MSLPRNTIEKWLKMCYNCKTNGPIVYRLGHILLKDGSRVRFPVGSHAQRAPQGALCISRVN